MTVNEAKEIKRLIEIIEDAGKMRKLLSKPKTSLTLNITNTYEYMGTHSNEIKVDSSLQKRFLETIEQYEKDLLDELSRYSLT